MLCVSVVVGCLVLDTAPQGKRGGHQQQHSPLMFSSDSGHVALESCCVVAVCQCGGGVPGPRHSAAGEERGGGGITSNTHRSFCLGPWMVFVSFLEQCRLTRRRRRHLTCLDEGPRGRGKVPAPSCRIVLKRAVLEISFVDSWERAYSVDLCPQECCGYEGE